MQVHIVKKTNKWECKLCGVKQSIIQVFGNGSSKECRIHVQKLNKSRFNSGSVLQNDDFTLYDSKENTLMNETISKQSENNNSSLSENGFVVGEKNKWNKYVENNDENSLKCNNTFSISGNKRKSQSEGFKNKKICLNSSNGDFNANLLVQNSSNSTILPKNLKTNTKFLWAKYNDETDTLELENSPNYCFNDEFQNIRNGSIQDVYLSRNSDSDSSQNSSTKNSQKMEIDNMRNESIYDVNGNRNSDGDSNQNSSTKNTQKMEIDSVGDKNLFNMDDDTQTDLDVILDI